MENLSTVEILPHVALKFPYIGILRLPNWTLRVTALELNQGVLG